MPILIQPLLKFGESAIKITIQSAAINAFSSKKVERLKVE